MSLVLGLDPAIATLGFALIERPETGPAQLVDLGVFVTASDLSMGARFAELARDVSGYLRDIDDSHGRVGTLVVEVPTFLRDASASSKLWGGFALLMGLSQGRLFVERSTSMWRASLSLPTERAQAPRGSDAQTKAKASREAKARRKASTAALMYQRYPDEMSQALMGNVPPGLLEHAIDALAIATSWHDDCRKHAAQRTLEV